MTLATDSNARLEFDPVIVRTHFGDDLTWEAVKRMLTPPEEDEGGVPVFVDDPRWENADTDTVLVAVATGEIPAVAVVFLADQITMETDHHALVVATTLTREECDDEQQWEYETEFGRQFRAVPETVLDIQVNMELANMDFPDFSSVAYKDPEGIYRRTSEAAASESSLHERAADELSLDAEPASMPPESGASACYSARVAAVRAVTAEE
ncbi:hypothetical protein [Streptomyces sp. NPDC052721]|uniref:DUF6924 domain-containing protein n=1 Tax=Streptomyces sp. NPDC052721 TaxID=3154955 RepID=UPI0034393CC8